MHRLAKNVLSSVLPFDPGMTLTFVLEVTATKGRRKMNSIKRDKSYWEHVFIAHRKIQKSSSSDCRGLLEVEVEGIVVDEGPRLCCFCTRGWIGLENTRYARAYPSGDPIHVNFSCYCN
ncbi:hypothetical protein M9H77_25645 [Catharanthus roseus]|uniref:Uncharacterized protein n=1 Tax=Catharanthus roseus TaxID=4058 RepID=A0ACC0AA57_CATRO|nr:hypothetical protein M9H77_25645 [Catharanthus roseus]